MMFRNFQSVRFALLCLLVLCATFTLSAKKDKEPKAPSGVKTVASKLSQEFDPKEFVNGFTVRAEDLKEDIFYTESVVMPYRYFVPKNLAKGAKVPLVIFLHGAGENGTDNILQLKHPQCMVFCQPENQKKFPCFFLAPQLVDKGTGWVGWINKGKGLNGPVDEMRAVVDLIDDICERHPEIDMDRIYTTGLSSGGLGALQMIAMYPGKFAGSVPISAGCEMFVNDFVVRQKIGVWAFYNRSEKGDIKDECDEILKKINQMGGEVRRTTFNSPKIKGHNSWRWAYAEPDLIPWLFQHKRDKTIAPSKVPAWAKPEVKSKQPSKPPNSKIE